jgi:hypothetical protein
MAGEQKTTNTPVPTETGANPLQRAEVPYSPQTTPRSRRAAGPGSLAMQARVAQLRGLLAAGYTVLEAGREIGLTRSQSQDTARRFGLRALPGPISEAKHLAGVRGNEVRWGASA